MTKILLLVALLVPLSVGAVDKHSPRRDPFFQMADAPKRRLAESAIRIRKGDSYKQVIELLGAPTSDQRGLPKQDKRRVVRTLSYYAVKWEKDLVNEFMDQLVDVFLDEHDRVICVYVRLSLE